MILACDFPAHLRDAYEGKYRSVRRLALAIQKVYGEEAISESTIKRLLSSKDYRPRSRRPYLQLKHVLPKLEIPQAEAP